MITVNDLLLLISTGVVSFLTRKLFNIRLGVWVTILTLITHLKGDLTVPAAFGIVVVWLGVERWKGKEGKTALEAWICEAEEEKAIEPEMEIIDPHHHFWDVWTREKFELPFVARWVLTYLNVNPLPWNLKTTFGIRTSLIPPYLAEHFDTDMFGPTQVQNTAHHNVKATVCIESGWKDTSPGTVESFKSFGEIPYAMREAKRSKSQVLCKAVIPHLDLSLGADIEPALKHLKSIGVTGIRDSLAWASDRYGLYSPPHNTETRGRDENFREGFKLLGEYGMTYDTWVYQSNLEVLAELARDFPKVTIICDHVGGPLGIAPNTPESNYITWREGIAKLSQHPNVLIKLSGLGMPHAGFGFHDRPSPPTSAELAEAWSPYITHCIKSFSPSRCMFASNFPVDKVSGSYTAFWNAFKIITKEYPSEEREQMFYKVAKETYKLEGKM